MQLLIDNETAWSKAYTLPSSSPAPASDHLVLIARRATRPTYNAHLLHQHSLALSLSSRERTSDAKLSAVAVDTVHGVQVLLDHDLEASSAALAGSNNGPSKEEFPDPEPAGAVLGLDDVEVAEPVAVPAPESGGVVDADGVDARIQS